MKKLLLIATKKEIMTLYMKELSKIFSEFLLLYASCVEDPIPWEILDDIDIILLTSVDSFHLARNYIKPHTAVIHLDFTFTKGTIDSLKLLPEGTNVWVCFSFYYISHQVALALQQAGVKNLNFHIFDSFTPNLCNKGITTALVSDFTMGIPKDIPYVINMGQQKISYATVLDIAVKAGILTESLEDRIYTYFNDVAVPNDHLSYFYDISATAKMQLKTITNCIDYAIIIFDHTYGVVSFNENLQRMFDFHQDITGIHIHQLSWVWAITSTILAEHEFHNKLVEIKATGKRLLISKEKINKKDKDYNIFIVLLKDITDIFHLENNLRNQINKKGYVTKYNFSHIKGKSHALCECVRNAKKISKIDKPTLIVGESGSGKELFAQSIHHASYRNKFSFIAINCAAIPPSLLESELFGYAEGSFTGAKKGGKIGLFEMAHKGTLFLDEIGELPLETQAKLLRVLEEKEIMRIGSNEIISIDVRTIAATNRDLDELVNLNKFRLDLYYRLNTLMIHIPPLRDRREDIPLLIDIFLKDEGFPNIQIDSQVMDFFMGYSWKGNLRELKNSVEYMANICDGTILTKHLPYYIAKEANNMIPAQDKNIITTLNMLNSNDIFIVKSILIFLKEKSMGRRNLLEALQGLNILVSEYKLRDLLLLLKEQQFVIFGKRRVGTIITKQGEQLLLKMKNGNINSTL